MPIKKTIALTISKFLILFQKLRHGNHIKFGRGVILNHRFKFRGKGRLTIEPNANLWAHEEPNRFFTYDKSAHIIVGKNSRLNGLTCHCQKSVIIGQDCLVASASISDTDFHTFDDPDHILFKNQQSKPVKIGNKAWICGQTTILKGSEIGEGTVVGFRAVVTKKFPANVVVAGNPARIVKQKSERKVQNGHRIS